MDIGDTIAANIARLIEERGTNPSAVSRAAGMGHTSVRDIIRRASKDPSYANLLKIAKVLNVDITEITVGPGGKPLDPEEAELLDAWSQLEPAERRFVLKSAKGLVSQDPEGES